MDLTIRIYTQHRGASRGQSRTILLNEGELEGIIEEYLLKEGYVKEDETIETITFEDIKL